MLGNSLYKFDFRKNNLIKWKYIFSHFLLLIVLTFTSSKLSYSQACEQSYLDSLQLIIKESKNSDINKISAYLALSKYYLDINLDSVSSIALKAMAFSKALDYKKGIAVGNLRLAQVEETKGNSNEALELFDQAISLYAQLEKDTDYFQAVNSIGNIYQLRHDYDKALEYYQIGLREANLQNFSKGKAFFYNNISVIYSDINSEELALEYVIKASKLFKELGHMNYYSNSLLNIGAYYEELGEPDSAKYYFQQAEKLQIENSNYYGLTTLYGNLGNISLTEGNVDDALYFFEKALSAANAMDSLNPNRDYKLAEAYLYIGKTCLIQHKYSKAKTNLLPGFEIARHIKSIQLQKEGSKGIFDFYLSINQKDSAALYLDIFLEFNDSLLAEKYNERIDKLNFEYQLQIERELSEKEKELVVLEKNRQGLIYLTIVGILFTLALGIFTLWFFQKNKLQKSELTRENLRLAKEKISNTLDRKNRELTTSVLNLIERNEFIENISEKLKNTTLDKEEDNQNLIESVIYELDKSSSNDLWKEFEVRFHEVHGDFYNRLINNYPDLTPNEQKLCAFLYLKMSTKEIASITYQSYESLRTARYRLRKKLGLIHDENLVAFLTQV